MFRLHSYWSTDADVLHDTCPHMTFRSVRLTRAARRNLQYQRDFDGNVRLPGSGSVDVGDGFLLIYAGSPGDGSLGGVALLLSPSAARSWRQAGSRAKHWDSGRELRISLRCPEGLWHVGSAYGPTEQQDALVKDQFYQDLRDLNSRVGVRGAADAEADPGGDFDSFAMHMRAAGEQMSFVNLLRLAKLLSRPLFVRRMMLMRWFSTHGMCKRPLCADRAAEARKFADHFETVLNVDRPTDPAAWRALPAQNYTAPLPAGLWDPPVFEEFAASVRKLARGKAPDLTGNHAELFHALLDAGDAGQAFDSVNRDQLWGLLRHQFAVPGHVVDMLQRIHDRMSTHVLHAGSLGREVPMRTGVRPGSIEGPTLYLLFYTVVLQEWRSRCSRACAQPPGVPWVSTRDGTLRLPSRTRVAYRDTLQLFDLEYADDTVMVDCSWDRFVICARLLDSVLTDFGVEMNLAKTEWMMVSGFGQPADAAPLPGARRLVIRGQVVPRTLQFKYLGSLVAADASLGVDADVRRHIGLAWAAFGYLKHVWRSHHIALKTKSTLLRSCVLCVLLFGCESWSLRSHHLRLLTSTWLGLVRGIQGLTWQQQRDGRLSASDLLARVGLPSLHTLLFQRVARWLGHVARRPPGRSIPFAMLFGSLPGRVCPPASVAGTQKRFFTTTARLVLQAIPTIDERVCARTAGDRAAWRRCVSAIKIDPPTRSAPVRAAPVSTRRAVAAQAAAGRDPSQCPSCQFRARNAQGLMNHINEKHPVESSSWTCEHCGKVYHYVGETI
ncbi:unnamed protein product [Symbiodinium sp. KB8]|nr:unnamed protein product [Symbiodinium sp. KB8]